MNKNVLIIAPLPPPIDGQSKACAESLKAFSELGWSIDIVNLRRKHIKRSVYTEIIRFFDILTFFIKIFILSRKSDVIYISLSESYLGNFKDLLIYIIIYKKLKHVTIHMLGGTGMNILLNKNCIISFANGFFMKKMNSVIVEGFRGIGIFKKYFPCDRIKIINNFVDDYLHACLDDVMIKFCNDKVLNILYLSNMLQGKGYIELFEGFTKLPSDVKKNMTLTFVGGFQDERSERYFLNLIYNVPGVNYLRSFIDGKEKKELYLKSHIFCLPTYYPYEGQPISILEAYSTGCFVITTSHGGVADIFVNDVNGYLVGSGDSDDVSKALKYAHNNKVRVKEVAIFNMFEAQKKYRSEIYRNKLRSIYEFHSLNNL